MRFWTLVNFLFIFLLITSCSAPKVLVLSDKQLAESAIAEGNFSGAVQSWKQYFQKTPLEEILGSDFATAAKTAYKAGDSDQALSWFNEARYKDYSDFEMYNTLAEMAREQSNISKELSALSFIIENFPEQTDDVNTRLFEIYSDIKEPEKALDAWEVMSDASKNMGKNLVLYFDINKSLKDTVVCDSVANELLKINPNQADALEWIASKYYWQGENQYQSAMAEYNRNKTNRQYRILLKELETSTADFKKALTYLEKLWKIEPGKKYANYFANIYALFGV